MSTLGRLKILLALPEGDLGDAPKLIEFIDPANLRMPSGKEIGAYDGWWVPGGFTGGGIPEAVIDQAPEGTYIIQTIVGK